MPCTTSLRVVRSGSVDLTDRRRVPEDSAEYRGGERRRMEAAPVAWGDDRPARGMTTLRLTDDVRSCIILRVMLLLNLFLLSEGVSRTHRAP